LFFIIAIAAISAAQVVPPEAFSPIRNISAIVLVLFVFWLYNRIKFSQLRKDFNQEIIGLEEAKRKYFTLLNFNFVLSVLLFVVEIFYFDLKYLLTQIPFLGSYDIFVHLLGMLIFLLHVSIVWYWGFRYMADVLEFSESALGYIISNIKFNLIILIPWFILSIIYTLLELIQPGDESIVNSLYFQIGFLNIFIVVLSIFAPALIKWLWNCRPIPSSELKDKIIAFCNFQKIKFRNIMLWDTQNMGLITAGVMGLVAPFRYLLITPGLMKLLNEDEILAVVSHEVGHVKKRHHILYLMFFIGFINLLILAWLVFNLFLFYTPLGLEFMVISSNSQFSTLMSILNVFVPLLLLVLYIRFVFGYFMRNFERQADGYCFLSGIDPKHLISSFLKLEGKIGESKKKSNWHHFNISQRINFLSEAIESPEIITAHSNRLKKRVITFFSILIAIFGITFISYKGLPSTDYNYRRAVMAIEKRLEKTPNDSNLYMLLGSVYYELKEFSKAKKAYEYSLELKYNQPEVLNNLAWLLLKSEDKSMIDPQRALHLAKDAAKLTEADYILDTLAEAYYENGMIWEAFKTAKRALEISSQNRSYFKKQVEKMKKAMKEH
jgi:Zn-dependent protease with chaperone function